MARKSADQPLATQVSDDSPEDPQENEHDLHGLDRADFNAVMAATDWTTETVIGQLNKGNIVLNPNFQRRDAWKPIRKSKFIESLILGLPVPQIVLAERKEKKGSYIVIDGKQRLLSLAQFSANKGSEFKQLFLQGLEVRSDLNGYNYIALQENPAQDVALAAFENQTIRTVVIKNWPTENFLYAVFLRLNTNSVKLSPQELRQALHPGPFSKFIDDYSIESDTLKAALRLEEPDFRMRDVELVLRHLAFRNHLTDYKGNLKAFLDEATREFNENWDKTESELKEQLKAFEKAINVTFEVFGQEDAFRKWNGKKFEGTFNRAVFDIMVEYFVEPKIASAAVKNKKAVTNAFKRLCIDDREFLSSIEATTKSVSAVVTRLSKWGNALQRILKKPIATPKLRENRIMVG